MAGWSPLRSLQEMVNKEGNKVSDVTGFQEIQDGICRIPPCLVETASLRCRGENTALWRKVETARRNALGSEGGPVGNATLYRPMAETRVGEVML